MMADELREAEEILGVLDQHALANGPSLSRAYHRFYTELLLLAGKELAEWNSEASSGLHDTRRMLYRCQNSQLPYHTPEDGPCEVYMPNWDASAGGGAVSLCDVCAGKKVAL
jgi:hypothetical protein